MRQLVTQAGLARIVHVAILASSLIFRFFPGEWGKPEVKAPILPHVPKDKFSQTRVRTYGSFL